MATARAAFGTGQYLLAFDDAKRGLALEPTNLELRFEAAKALIELRALDDARALLAEARHSVGLDDDGLAVVAERTRATVEAEVAAGSDPAAESARLAVAPAGGDVYPPILRSKLAEEALGLVGRLLKEIYKETGSVADARRCKQAYLAAYAASGGYWTCTNVATVARLLAARDPANADDELRDVALFAQRALMLVDAEASTTSTANPFWPLATRAEALLLLGDADGSAAAYGEAIATGQPTFSMRESVRRQLRLLRKHGVAIPAAVDALFRPPAVLCFSGHMVDAPGRPTPRFPAAAEPAVRTAVAAAIDGLAAPNLIGYCSGACGGDLIFAELLLARGAQVELFLPFAREDFVRTSVAFAGDDWVRQFDAVVAGSRVTYVTTEPLLGTDALFGHCNHVMAGAARLRAESFGVVPTLVALADPGQAAGGPFGVGQMIGLWPAERTRVVDLRELREVYGASGAMGCGTPLPVRDVLPDTGSGVPQPMPPMPSRTEPSSSSGLLPDQSPSAIDGLQIDGEAFSRDISALLFADVHGYSSLSEGQVPLFLYRFVRRVADAWALTGAPAPLLVETWGDAFYCVMPTAMAAVAYASALRRVVADTNWPALGLPADLSVRVSLHAGPVYAGRHPMTHDRTYFGSHVTRAARIEPITRPGHVYASLPFVSLLTTEQAEAERAGAGPPAGGWGFRCEYIGRIELAKAYGVEPLFQVRGR